MAKTIIVTGAAGALGRVVAQQLQDGGAQVHGVDMADSGPDGLTAFHGGIDLSDGHAVADLIAKVAGDAGGIDGLVNIVGGFVWETVDGGSVESWDRMYQMNVRPTLLMSQAALPHLRESNGAIVNVGANGAIRSDAGMGAYAASKAGVHRLTESLAAEEKDSRVRVNAVLPTIIDTPTNRADMPDADFDSWVQPAEIGAVAAFLLSDGASAVTGACIPVVGRV